MTKVVAVDFFCGAGGMTRGLIEAGIHVLAGIDNEPVCEKTYRQNRNANRNRPQFLCKNIFPKSKTHPDGQQSEIAEELHSLLREFRKKHGRTKLVFAICAPCQPFTKITQIEMSDRRKFKRDNDANLLLTTVNLIKKFRPDGIICENVEGIIGADETSVIARFKRALKRNGYEFDAKVVKMAAFGVPQYRSRTIGIAVDKIKYKRLTVEIPDRDSTTSQKVTVESVIGHLPPLAAGEKHPSIPNHRARALNDLNLKRISCAKPGENNLYLKDTPYGDLSLDCHRRLEEKWGVPSFSDTYTRMRGDDLAPTITTHCISITNGRFGHYDVSQNRGITPREAALLQTFPEDYIFYPEDNISLAATLIGNAVPPRLAQFYGSYLIKTIARRSRKAL